MKTDVCKTHGIAFKQRMDFKTGKSVEWYCLKCEREFQKSFNAAAKEWITIHSEESDDAQLRWQKGDTK